MCATKQLGIKIPAEELARTEYPNGITFPASAYVPPRDKATKTKIKKFRRELDATNDAAESSLAAQDAQKECVESSSDDEGKPQARRTATPFDRITFA